MIANIKQLQLFKTALITVDSVLKSKVHTQSSQEEAKGRDAEAQSMLQMTNLDDREETVRLDATTDEAHLLLA